MRHPKTQQPCASSLYSHQIVPRKSPGKQLRRHAPVKSSLFSNGPRLASQPVTARYFPSVPVLRVQKTLLSGTHSSDRILRSSRTTGLLRKTNNQHRVQALAQRSALQYCVLHHIYPLQPLRERSFRNPSPCVLSH